MTELSIIWLDIQYFTIIMIFSIIFTTNLVLPFMHYVSTGNPLLYCLLYLIQLVGICFMFWQYNTWFEKEYKSDNTGV